MRLEADKDDSGLARLLLMQEPPPVSAYNAQAITAWNVLGGYELQRLPALQLVMTINDPEGLLLRLQAIRDALH